MMSPEDIDLLAVYCLDGPLLEALMRYRRLSVEDQVLVTACMVQIKYQRSAAAKAVRHDRGC
jgi:hypothetical protein